MMTKLILASQNAGKVRELQNIFEDLKFELLSLNDFKDIPVIIEDGNSFEENAKIKADKVYNFFKIHSVGDDSGLSVEQLNGDPGIYSARFAGEDATDDENNAKLIDELKKYPEPHVAKYVCAAAYYNGENFIISTGEIKGKIISEPRGHHGFGYDPYFIPDGYTETMAEIDPAVKNRISHRGIAFNKLKNILIEKEIK